MFAFFQNENKEKRFKFSRSCVFLDLSSCRCAQSVQQCGHVFQHGTGHDTRVIHAGPLRVHTQVETERRQNGVDGLVTGQRWNDVVLEVGPSVRRRCSGLPRWRFSVSGCCELQRRQRNFSLRNGSEVEIWPFRLL